MHDKKNRVRRRLCQSSTQAALKITISANALSHTMDSHQPQRRHGEDIVHEIIALINATLIVANGATAINVAISDEAAIQAPA